MKNIAIIPARSGSKGVKDKNIKELNGKPLISYTIQAAVDSGVFDEIMVSTDSEKYASIAKKYGAKVPFLRSERTATDTASSWDMIDEVLNQYQWRGIKFESFCLLQPTSPLRTAEEKASLAVVSVCEAEHSPLWCGHLPQSGEFIDFVEEDVIKRRQEGQPFYRLNGAIYIVCCEGYRTNRFLYKEGSYAYIMPQERSIDIDTELDFKIATVIARDMNI